MKWQRIRRFQSDVDAPPALLSQALKAEKRRQREEREAAAPAAEAVAPVVAATEVAAPPAGEPEGGALALLSSAEALAVTMHSGVAATTSAIAAYKENRTADGAASLQHSVTVLTGQIGLLQSKIDEVCIGDLEEGARDAAKARRKALNVGLEEQLVPAVTKLRSATSAAALAA